MSLAKRRAFDPAGVSRVMAAATAALTLAACSTTDIVNGFNVSPHGSDWDPAVRPPEAARRLVDQMIVDEMTGAYFRKSCDNGFKDWFTWATANSGKIIRDARATATPPNAAEVRRTGARRFQSLRAKIHGTDDVPWRKDLAAVPNLCAGAKTVGEPGQHLADAIRFEVSLGRVLARAAAWCDEGLVDCSGVAAKDDLQAGLTSGFAHATEYLANRHWHRDPARANVGVVMSGGGSNGMFTAGAAWQLLEVVDHCLKTPGCGDRRFRLISGTSAGSMVAAIVDLYNAEYDQGEDPPTHAGQGGQVLNNLVGWFTCLEAPQLYCVDTTSSLTLLTDKTGIVSFDGIRVLLAGKIKEQMLHNTSELFLNTVDFQSGFLLAPSDQDPRDTKLPSDIVEHALSSIPEPLIAQPIPALRLGSFTATAPKGTPGFFLDGGVLSVVPLMPVIRHGADRVVLISSSPSIVSGSPPPTDPFSLLTRYIDISVNGAGGDGVNLATSFAEVRRSSEQAACLEAYAGACDDVCQRFCSGDILEACDSKAPTPNPATGKLPAERTYPMISIYRDDSRVSSAPGYSFDPDQSYPLFVAGAEAVRERCLALGYLIGIPETFESQLRTWCNLPLPVEKVTTRCAGVQKPFPKWTSTAMRPCTGSP
jgi:predicted acylesterase/phospholipase RssA